MRTVIKGFKSSYELERLARMLFHWNSVEEGIIGTDDYIYVYLSASNDKYCVFIEIKLEDQRISRFQNCCFEENDSPIIAASTMMLELCGDLGRTAMLRWGILTGIRPVKLFRQMGKKVRNFEEIADILHERYHVSRDMCSLALDIAKQEERILNGLPSDFVNLYISVPFCPTRCRYCSFVSQSIEKEGHLIPEYINCLYDEIKHTARVTKELNLKIKTVYIGGGTPTCLTNIQLDSLLKELALNFNLGSVEEYTVEAGRPETIDEKKLAVLIKNKVNRICINPQTMNDSTLKLINRKHTQKEIVYACELAKYKGIKSINMDLIAGLPGEDCAAFAKSFNSVLALNPENITVHALTIKRGSDYYSDVGTDASRGLEAERMVDLARLELREHGYKAYYLYRQGNTLGNLENVGYSKPGHECIYNISMMSESQSVLGIGAGSVTKLVNNKLGKIKRIYNRKFPHEYIRDISRGILSKKEIIDFYEGSV
jgi:oxygen-independent coproporphyrinogen-3 oxidase